FSSTAERTAFRERWLGRYIDRWPHLAYVALDEPARVAGYLVGCLENPAQTRLFQDIAYFKAFARECARYPAHLHINLREDVRGRGIGSALIEAFAQAAHAAGVPGLHIVTAQGARNVSFYERNGFRVLAADTQLGITRIFMGRDLH
ncbi:MAG: GNAT family N-acetyltransferase, partial [Parvularculaceae bacterium]|nr:GNAT family N-acetyltransferase [Parvularculaceae bacterium]